MSIFEELLHEIQIPEVVKVKYRFVCSAVSDLESAVISELNKENVLDRINEGNTVAIALGSREITKLSLIVKTLVDAIKARGGKPFIIPAMGSHGGATAMGQEEVLSNFGITENIVGAPVISSMETVEIGRTQSGIPVYMDKYAYQADCIIPVGRIKPHTDFRGQYESGLMKMIAIWLGKQKGASICHQLGLENMSNNVYAIAGVSLRKTKIVFGLGIIENAFHGIYKITALPKEEIELKEPELLLEAKSLIPVIPFKKVDVIVIDEMGKDISGTGMDSNVIGRSSTLGIWEPYAERIAVLDLTAKSHGNANGIGLADVTTMRLYNKMDFEYTYPNAITSAEPKAVKIPMVMPNDELAIKCAVKVCTGVQSERIRMLRIKNTLSMNEFYISEALVKEAKGNNEMEIIGRLESMKFNYEGNLAEVDI